MTKKKRSILFLISGLLFLLAAPSLIFYSQGYRIDFKNKMIVKTGGLYFKVVPTGAEIYINGGLKKRTDAFFRAAFFENLVPKKYLIEIKKEGYFPWQKELIVEQNKVTEAKNVILVPKTIRFETVLTGVKNIAFSPDEKALIIGQNTPSPITDKENEEKEIWELKVYSPEKNIKSHLVNEMEISKAKVWGATLINFDLTPELNNMILETEINNEKQYFVLDLDKNPVFIKPLEALKDIKNVSLHPLDQNKIFFQKNGSEDSESLTLFESNLETQALNPFLQDVIAYKALKEGIFWLSEQGILNKTDFSGNTQALTLFSLPIKKEVIYKIDALNSYIFLKENDALFVLDNDLKIFTKIADKANSFSVSPDLKKICFWNDSEVWILFLKDDLTQPQKNKGEKILLVGSEKIGNVFWFNSHHLILSADTKVKIVEIDDRDKIQTWELIQFVNPEIYFNQKDRKLYILSEEKLIVSEKF